MELLATCFCIFMTIEIVSMSFSCIWELATCISVFKVLSFVIVIAADIHGAVSNFWQFPVVLHEHFITSWTGSV